MDGWQMNPLAMYHDSIASVRPTEKDPCYTDHLQSYRGWLLYTPDDKRLAAYLSALLQRLHPSISSHRRIPISAPTHRTNSSCVPS
mmetsp:Transcript_29178/g.84350  ORF Transcript_29178/g.84350 Transcript_29178/m.84350 type:complete len:86 (+) Transcript_29178:45-302(+)